MTDVLFMLSTFDPDNHIYYLLFPIPSIPKGGESSIVSLLQVCGQRLLTDIVDTRALSNHPRPFATVHGRDGFRDVSYLEFANAINRAAWWLRDISSRGEVLAYMGPGDLRYQIFILAAVKSGNVLFVPSPRNSSQDLEVLVREAEATKLLTTQTKIDTVESINIPELEELLDLKPAPWIRFTKSFADIRFEPFIIIHTSGSTGTPKLITLKHGNICAVDAMQTIGGNEIHARLGDMRLACTFPLFHVGGIIYALTMPLILDSTVILPPVGPVNAEVVNTIHVQGRAEFSILPPSLIVDLAKEPEYMRTLKRLRGLNFSGGPLPESVGSQIVEHTQLIAGWGASEYQSCPQLRKDKEDWAFLKFNEKDGGIEFRERDGNLFEMVHVRHRHLDHLQPVFITYPELDEFYTKDLFAPHPTKPGLWKYVSRADDIIVLSNGEKLNPTTAEGTITSSPDVKSCLIVGHGRFQVACIIEPRDLGKRLSDNHSSVWPFIARANDKLPQHGRIMKDAVIYTPADKPFPRAAKGTIQRAMANQVFSQEINELYNNLASANPGNKGLARLEMGSCFELQGSILEFLTSEMGMKRLSASDDFFAHGMDSSMVVSLVRAINSSTSEQRIRNRQVYDYPTAASLAGSLLSRPAVRDGEDSRDDDGELDQGGYDSDDEELISAWIAMDQTFHDFSRELGPSPRSQGRKIRLRSDEYGPAVQPDGGRNAWLQVLGSFLVNINNWGLVNAFGEFQSFYASNLLASHSVVDIWWIGTIQGALLLIVGVVSGPLFDKGYFKIVTVLASVGLVVALLGLSFCGQYYQVFLVQGVVIGICSGLLYIPSVAILPVYFKKRRGLALGLSTCGGSVGGIIYPVVFRQLLESIGFGWATRVVCLVAFFTLGIACIIIEPLGSRTRRQLIDRGALRDPFYILFMISAFLLFSAILVPLFLGPAFGGQLSAGTHTVASYILVFFNLGQLFGRVLPAVWSDFNHRYTTVEALLFSAELGAGILAFAWISVDTLPSFAVWAVVYGFITGMAATLPALVMPHLCPNLAVYGTRLGMLYACAGLGFLISTPIAAAASQASGGYSGAQVWTGSCCSAAAFVFGIVGWKARKQRRLYESGKQRSPWGRAQILKDLGK